MVAFETKYCPFSLPQYTLVYLKSASECRPVFQNAFLEVETTKKKLYPHAQSSAGFLHIKFIFLYINYLRKPSFPFIVQVVFPLVLG